MKSGGKTVRAHRFYYERINGPIPDGLELDHLCRVHSCVNPDHLEPVTHTVNMRRGILTKLTAADVVELRACLDAGIETDSELAARFGVSRWSIWNVKHRKAWN